MLSIPELQSHAKARRREKSKSRSAILKYQIANSGFLVFSLIFSLRLLCSLRLIFPLRAFAPSRENIQLTIKSFVPILLIGGLSACATQRPVVTPSLEMEKTIPEAASTITEKHLRLAAVGDIMLGGNAKGVLEHRGYDSPFVATAHLLQQADLAIGNLETPLTDRGKPLTDKTWLFRNPPDKVGPALQRAGFDIVTLANNHTLDYGVEGLQDTFAALDKYGIRYIGAGLNLSEARRAVVIETPDKQTIGFLGYSNTFPEEFWASKHTPGTAFGHLSHVQEDVKTLVEQGVDIIVVSFHWGQERKTELRPYQPLLGRAAIDAGADLVIGHHPHILQGIERYKEGLILYSLGNYAFTTFSNAVNTSAVAEIEFLDGRFESLTMTPININNFQVELQPQILVGEKAEAVFRELDVLSKPLGVGLQYRNEKIFLESSTPSSQ
jgi:poly-gamma-glutamate synthesis protein (capsule biosynthesis protein)